MVAVREMDRDSRREPPIRIQDRERGAFAGNDALRQEQDAGRGRRERSLLRRQCGSQAARDRPGKEEKLDRKSTRLNSSHTVISYAVFCLKKKKKKEKNTK